MNFSAKRLLSLAFLLLLITAAPGRASQFTPAWKTTCGMGTAISEGCSAVRARKIVNAVDYPWSAIGRINIAGIRVRSHCTGTLIDERLVLTAAHCLYIKKRKKWVSASQIHFVAGFQRGKFVGHSRGVRYSVSPRHDTKSSVFHPRHSDDWALIELRDPIGARAGYLGWRTLNPADLSKALKSGATVALAGYPAVRPHVISTEMECKTPHFSSGEGLLIHRCAAMKGDSGAPLLLLQNGKATIAAVLSGAFSRQGDIVSVSVPVTTFHKMILKMLDRPDAYHRRGGITASPGRAPYP